MYHPCTPRIRVTTAIDYVLHCNYVSELRFTQLNVTKTITVTVTFNVISLLKTVGNSDYFFDGVAKARDWQTGVVAVVVGHYFFFPTEGSGKELRVAPFAFSTLPPTFFPYSSAHAPPRM